MLYQNVQIWNSSAFTHFHSSSGTATSSGTSERETVQERIGQNEEPTGTNKKRTMNDPCSNSNLAQ